MKTQTRSRPRRKQHGFTLIEVMVSLVVLSVCSYLLTSTISATIAHSVTQREQAVATDAAANVFEDMRNEQFLELLRLYDDDPLNDPLGPGTAAGMNFAVTGLTPFDGDLDGFVGRITLPLIEGQLREDCDLPRLELPRDLNGDTMVDAKDHKDDFIILPVMVTIEWDGFAGKRTLEITTMLAGLMEL
jgi:prepilin-type N-terminal cleavage/methylation domain-containing protein